MPSTATVAKDPNDTEDITWQWSNRLAAGETISTFSATVVDGTWAVGSSSISGTTTIARMTGGTAASTASVRGRIVTSTGRQLDWTIYMPIEEQ